MRERDTHSLVLPSFPFRMRVNRWFREIEQRKHQGFSRGLLSPLDVLQCK